MPPAVPVDNEKSTEVVEVEGKVLERSQQDGELYSKPTIGIIYPPPEVRNIVDRTANFVARNGPEFEVRIRGNEADNPKFNFLNPNDPYYAYYEHKLKEFRETDAPEPAPLPPTGKDATKLGQQQKQKTQQQQVVETIVPKDPPPQFEYISDPPTISAIDLDIVKLTAQFVAKNGKAFLTNLMTREQRNYQFDFLRPQHSLFQYFTRLVEQYTKILLPPGDISQRLEQDVMDPWKVLDRVQYRVEWQKYQDREKRKEEDEKERERIAFAQIDWHDFVVVETVNFREQEIANLPPPVSKDQLGARILAQERLDKAEDEGEEEELPNEQMEMDVEDEEEELYQPFAQDQEETKETEEAEEEEQEEKAGSDMEEESDDEDKEDAPKPPQMPPPMLPPTPGVNATVRRNYDPKAKAAPQSVNTSDQFLISPLTGEKVSAESMQQHMKISLLDPRWKEQKEKAIEEKRQQERVYAEGVHIGDTLKQLAERRSDIFGVGAEETLIGRKLGEEEDQSKVTKEIWDGHTASMERATKLAHSNITFEDQIKAIHRSKGLLPSEDAEKIGPAVPQPNQEPPQAKEPPTPPILPPQPPPVSKPPAKPESKPIANPEKTITIEPPTQPIRSAQPPPAPTPPAPALLPPPPFMGRPGGPPIPPPPGPPRMGMVRPPMMPPRMMMPPQNMNQQRPRFIPPPIPPPSDEPPTIILPPPIEEEEDEPAFKKSKIESLEADLVPEDLFLETNRLPVTFRVQVPDLPDKPEWQCQGQVLTISLPLKDQCSVIKAKIFEMIEMPAGKQKLQLRNFFIKDSNTLAFYNFNSSSLVQLQVKERGGRKK